MDDTFSQRSLTLEINGNLVILTTLLKMRRQETLLRRNWPFLLPVSSTPDKYIIFLANNKSTQDMSRMKFNIQIKTKNKSIGSSWCLSYSLWTNYFSSIFTVIFEYIDIWPVFLTHVGIRQMPTRLPTWKAKLLYHVGTFLPTWFILPLKSCKDIFKYTCFTLYPKQTVNNWESAIVFIDRHCLWCFFSADIRSNQFRVDLII